MKDFLRMINKLYMRNYEDCMEAIKEQQVPCAYFYPNKFFYSDVIDGIREWGVRVDTICTWDENIANLDCTSYQITGLTNFLKDPQDVRIMLLHPCLWLTVLDKRLAECGVDVISLCNMQDAINVKSYMIENLPQLYETYSYFNQAESRKAYLGAIVGRISGQIRDYHFAPEPQYMLEGFFPKKGDIVIDGGAYDGGTAKLFTSLGGEVFAFEMDRKNYSICYKKAQIYGFVVENMGLSDMEFEAHYQSSGTGSAKHENGTETAHFISIDTYVERSDIPRIDYIKLDVEGAELEVLRGAASSIVKWKPKMAISAYHKLGDLWTLREYISSICPSYRFEFRHYPIDVADYWLGEQEKSLLAEYNLGTMIPTSCEMVLYCY